MSGRKKARFVTAVWGEAYVRHYLDVLVPTQLSDGNLPAFAALHDAAYAIYCPSEDAERIRKHPVFKLLCEAVRIEFDLIDDLDRRGNKYEVMGACHRRAIRRANAEDAALVFLSADTISPDGTFAGAARHYAHGKRLVVTPSLRVNKEPFLAEFRRAFFLGAGLKATVAPRELVRLSLRFLHPTTLSYCADSPAFKPGPAVCWRVGGEGLVGRYFHMNPLLIHPRRKDFLPQGTIDDDFILDASGDQDVHVVVDSDEALVVDPTDPVETDAASAEPSGPAEAACWALFNANAQHRRFFARTVRVHGGMRSPAWEEARRRCDAFGETTLRIVRCVESAWRYRRAYDGFERRSLALFPSQATVRALDARFGAKLLAIKLGLYDLVMRPSPRHLAVFLGRCLVPKKLRPSVRRRAAAAKQRLKATPIWAAAKYALPRYFRPRLRLAAAKLLAALAAGARSRRRLALAYVGVAETQLYRSNATAAVLSLTRAVAADPTCAAAYHRRYQARCLQEPGRAALEDYERAVALGLRPETGGDEHFMLGNCHFEDFEDPAAFARAMRHYEAAIEKNPACVGYYLQAGAAHHILGQHSKAEEFFAKGVSLRRRAAEKRGLDARGVRFLASSWFLAVGHVALLDAYVKTRLLAPREDRVVLALRPGVRIPNRRLLDRFRDHIEVVSDPAQFGLSWEEAELLEDEFWAWTLPDGRTRWYGAAAVDAQARWEADRRPPLASLSDEERKRGSTLLKRLGVPEESWFVCLHVRESGFHRQWNALHPPTRDADVQSYAPAIRAVTQRGGWVIRVGDDSMLQLPPMERVVDYAHSPLKSEEADLYLLASCRFFMGTNSGLAMIPPLFGVPCALTNWAPIGAMMRWHENIVSIPKLHWLERERRLLSFDEMLDPEVGGQEFRRHFASRGIVVRDNTPEELAALAAEMLDRVDGTAAYSTDDERLQDRFRRLAESRGCGGRQRVGRDFLRRHAALLETSERMSPA